MVAPNAAHNDKDDHNHSSFPVSSTRTFCVCCRFEPLNKRLSDVQNDITKHKEVADELAKTKSRVQELRQQLQELERAHLTEEIKLLRLENMGPLEAFCCGGSAESRQKRAQELKKIWR